MIAVIQRVSNASVEVENKIVGLIKNGLFVLLGIKTDDNEKDVEYLSYKISNLRIFSDENLKMNLSIKNINGEILIVSQFTLCANTEKGHRPDFFYAAKPNVAEKLYQLFIQKLEQEIGKQKIQTGIFGATMNVKLENNGPVTIIIDSKNVER